MFSDFLPVGTERLALDRTNTGKLQKKANTKTNEYQNISWH
jgi:hypothetical protein